MGKPYRQGDLDGLCGIYAVVNAFHVLFSGVELPSGLGGRLFEEVAGAIPRREYPEILWEGLDAGRLVKVATQACGVFRSGGLHITAERPFVRLKFKNRNEYFDAIDGLWKLHYAAFIVAIDWAKKDGGYGHWTVLKAIENNYISIYDSAGQRKLPTLRLGIDGSRGTRLCPQETIMITLHMP